MRTQPDKQLVDLAPDAIVVVRRDGTIDYANIETQKIFGYAPEDLVGDRFRRRNFESIVMSTPDERKAWLDDVRRLVRASFPSAGGDQPGRIRAGKNLLTSS